MRWLHTMVARGDFGRLHAMVARGDRLDGCMGWLHEAEPAGRHDDGDRIGRFRDDGADSAQPPDATVPERENHPKFGYRDMIPCPCSHNQRLVA